MAKILTKGIALQFGGKLQESDTSFEWISLPGLQQFPDLGGDIDNVDVTTLADSNYQYIKGLQDFGELEFTFVYDTAISMNLPTGAIFAGSNFKLAKMLENPASLGYNWGTQWRVSFPDGTTFTFSGQPTATPVGAGVNDAIQFTLSFALSSDIVTNIAGVGGNPSDVVASPAGGKIPAATTITLSAVNAASIYYSVDGADFEEYSAPFAFDTAGVHIVRAFAAAANNTNITQLSTFSYTRQA